MKRCVLRYVAFALVLPSLSAWADDLKQCSTEKVNHEDCTVIVDRRYPITLPTIQMSPGKRVIVKVQDRLAFETLTLDETSATALPGTDQGAALLTAAIPDLKGLVLSNMTVPAQQYAMQVAHPEAQADPAEQARVDALNDTFKVLRGMLDSAQKSIPDDKSPFFEHVVVVYGQINQVLAPIPKPGSRSDKKFVPPPNAPGTPDPWVHYAEWRVFLLCELVGSTVDGSDCTNHPAFNNILGDIGKIQSRLPTTPPAAPPDDALFDQNTFAALVKQAKVQIGKLTDEADKIRANNILDSLQKRQNSLNSLISALANTLTNVQKDFLTYYQNIYLAKDTLPVPKLDKDNKPIPYAPSIGTIYDPRSPNANKHLAAYTKLLGRQVVFAINVVNNVSTPVNSVTPTSAKVSIATVTILFADPHFETSAGALFSFVHNRTFSNQTLKSTPPGSMAMPGDIVIFENKTSPEIVPFVAGHYRIGPDFSPSWLGNRRAAFYATIWLGLNPYSLVPEYGAGPTFSWRSFMFSALYNRGHESTLTQGLSVEQIVCRPSSTGAAPPPCTAAPPAPTTQLRGVNAFAIGISVRIPTSFAAGTGGVSR
jgi:hypothetical protein